MASYTKTKLSGSTNGRGIKVVATAIGSGTTIHTNASGLDVVDLFASNPDTTAYLLTLGWGGSTDPDDLIKVTIPGQVGLVPVAIGLLIGGTLSIVAAAGTANKLTIFGYANNIA